MSTVQTTTITPDDAQKKPEAQTLPPVMSKGERLYNWTVYSGINYWVNLISSIAMADYFINKGGRAKLDYIIGKGAKAVAATGLLGLKSSYKNVKTAFETFALMSGGWALLVPMKIMEDHKRDIVHWTNDKLGIDQTAADGHKMTAEEIYIEKEQPKQTWFNAIKRRIYATLAVVGTGQVIDHALADKRTMKPDQTFHLNPYDKNSETLTFAGHHMGGKEWLENKIVGFVNQGVNKIPGTESFTKPGSLSQRWLGLAALDTGFTKITALVMRFTNGAKKGNAPKEIQKDVVAAAPSPADIATPEDASTPMAEHKASSKILAKKKVENHVARVQNQQADTAQLSM